MNLLKIKTSVDIKHYSFQDSFALTQIKTTSILKTMSQINYTLVIYFYLN